MPSNVKSESEVAPAIPAPPQQHANFANVHIKSESGYEQPLNSYPPVPPMNGYPGGINANIAQQRAQALVAQRMGQAPPNMMQHQQYGQVPIHEQQRMMQGQGQQRPPQQMQQRPPQGQIYTSQTDGADGGLEDWKAFLAARAAAGDGGHGGRIAADNLMRTHIEAMVADQDSGLGMPLSAMPKGQKRKAITRVRQVRQAEASSSTSSVPRVAPFDGEDAKEEEENPEDAINSDLDDPEDDLDNADNSDDEMIDYMLCTYDKVQRVKNKWKCTLKDGVLTTNKKE